MALFSLCLSLWEQIWLDVLDFVQKPALMKGLAQSDAEVNRRDQCRPVCRLIFRGDPRIILGSDILSVSMWAPRYPSQMKNPDTVPCNSALNPGHWGFSITPQMEWMPLLTAEKRQRYLSSHQRFMPLELKNKWLCFCSISLIWNHITVCQDACFWSDEENFFFSLSQRNRLRFTFMAVFVVSDETFTVIVEGKQIIHCGAICDNWEYSNVP